MRAATPVPADLLAERRRLGHDKFDEMWEGELHLVPPANEEHQRIGGHLLATLFALVEESGLHLRHEIGLFDPAIPEPTSYRQPDLAVFSDAVRTERGIDGAAHLVVEIRSPGDESFQKLPFYERMGVGEVLIIDRDTKSVRRWALTDRDLVEAQADRDGWHHLAAIPVALRTNAGVLVVRTPDGTTQI